MPIQIRVMSWNIQKKRTNAAYVAKIMQTRQIDICALLEVPHQQAFTIPFQIITQLNNLAPAYFANDWTHQAVDVGNESVVYIWHETAAPGANAFMAERFANGGLEIAGKVTHNAANARIYFPTTKFNWAGLPGTPAGRRPSFKSFVTNDGAAARRFTVLDLHTPFNVNTSIQSYSTSLYATSREIMNVETQDAAASATAGAGGLATSPGMTGAVDPLLAGIPNPNNFLNAGAIRQAAVTAALTDITDTIEDSGADLPLLFAQAWNEGINGAVAALGPIPPAISRLNAAAICKACAMAGCVSAAWIVGSIRPPIAPANATASAAAAATAAQAAVNAQPDQYQHPAQKNSKRLRDAVRTEAKRLAVAAVAPFAFGALPQQPVNASIIAGDFNVPFPDPLAGNYTAGQQASMGGTNNAYARLTAITNGATNAQASTRIGPSAYEGQRVYMLRVPCPVQNVNPAGADYVPLDLTPLINTPTGFMGAAAWDAGLRALPRPPGVTWQMLINPPYVSRLEDAFDVFNLAMEVIDDTSFYRANCYDNIFVRAAPVGASGLIDVMSELGSWPARPAAVPNPQPVFAPNPWAAALGNLNPIANAELSQPGAKLQFTYTGVSYTIAPALANAEQAAVFFNEKISDHLPVFVAVQI